MATTPSLASGASDFPVVKNNASLWPGRYWPIDPSSFSTRPPAPSTQLLRMRSKPICGTSSLVRPPSSSPTACPLSRTRTRLWSWTVVARSRKVPTKTWFHWLVCTPKWWRSKPVSDVFKKALLSGGFFMPLALLSEPKLVFFRFNSFYCLCQTPLGFGNRRPGTVAINKHAPILQIPLFSNYHFHLHSNMDIGQVNIGEHCRHQRPFF